MVGPTCGATSHVQKVSTTPELTNNFPFVIA